MLANLFKIFENKNKLLQIRQQGVFDFLDFLFSKTDCYEFIFIFLKNLVLIKNVWFLSQILKIFKTIILKMLRFFSDFFSIFSKKGDQFPVDSATQHSRTIFFRLLMNLWK